MHMPVVSTMAAIYRDHLVLASNTQLPEIQLLVSRGQIVSADPLLLADGQTDSYNICDICVLLTSLLILW